MEDGTPLRGRPLQSSEGAGKEKWADPARRNYSGPEKEHTHFKEKTSKGGAGMSGEELDLGPIEEHLREHDSEWCEDYEAGGRSCLGDIADLIAEVKRLRGFIQQTEMADDIIYENYKRLMAQLPQCPEHGECVPYAIDWLKDLKTKNPGLVS
jgi:hypothetical protein